MLPHGSNGKRQVLDSAWSAPAKGVVGPRATDVYTNGAGTSMQLAAPQLKG